jgi:hypothetical protein
MSAAFRGVKFLDILPVSVAVFTKDVDGVVVEAGRDFEA